MSGVINTVISNLRESIVHSSINQLVDRQEHNALSVRGLRFPHDAGCRGGNHPARVTCYRHLAVDGVESTDIVKLLNEQGIRTHTRKADHYSGNILFPLNLPDCIRISMCHYNTTGEVARTLSAIRAIISSLSPHRPSG